MKPTVTWVVVANARSVNVFENRGPGKGLSPIEDVALRADEADLPRDKPGVGRSIAGPSMSAVEHSDPQAKQDAEFARLTSRELSKALSEKGFDRLIIVAGPHMLGLLRTSLDKSLQDVLIGEIPKDFTEQPLDALLSNVNTIIAA